MIIVFPYCHKDHDQAVRLVDWLTEIGPFLNHDLLIVRDVRAPLLPELRPLFRSSKELAITDDVHNSWPQSPNLMFAKAAKYIEYRPKQPWLWLEPDAIPLRASAFDESEAEYQKAVEAGKFFVGDFVHLPEPGFKDHMSGVAVYPPNMTHHAGDATISLDIAWDVQAARQILPKMFQSELILHRWKHPPFTSWEEVEQRIFAVRPKCALFHADKQGSLIPLLRYYKNNLPAPVLVEPEHSGRTATKPSALGNDESEARESINRTPSIGAMETQCGLRHPEKGTGSRGGQNIDEYQSPKDRAAMDFRDLPFPLRYEIKDGEYELIDAGWRNETPWQNREESIAEIQRLADRLKQFGDNASHVRAVRMILNDTGVITLPYRYKKRGKWRRKRKKT